MQPSITRPAKVLTEAEVTVAEAELQALEQHAVEPVRPAPMDEGAIAPATPSVAKPLASQRPVIVRQPQPPRLASSTATVCGA